MLDYAAGASRRAVTDDLNSTLGLNMAPSSVGKLMKNRLLMGIYVWGRESCSRLTGRKPCPQEEWQTARVPMPETLVDEATFEAVQARLKANTRTGYDCPDGRGDLLQGFLWCACGSRMFGHTARRGTPRQSTEYRCERCYHGRSMKKIDQTAVAIMADHGLPIVLNLPVAVEEPTGPDGGEDDRLRQLREQDAQLTAERVALTRQFSRGEIEAADYHATIRVTDGERRQVRDTIARAEQEHRQRQSQRVLVKRMVQQWKQDGEYERYCFAGKEEARQAFADFVERITFDRAADTLTVMWKAWLVDAPDDQTVTKPVGYLSELRPDRWRLGPQ
jgi:Recombinase